MGVQLFKKFLSALVDTATNNSDKTTLSQITPMELAKKKSPRDLMDPASMNPEQRTSTPTKQDFLNDETQKLAMKTHLGNEEIIHRDLAERMKFFSRSSSERTTVYLARRSEQNSARKKIWKMFEGGNYCCQRLHGCHQHGCLHFSGKCK